MERKKKKPCSDSVVLGFQLLCVFVNSFGPSKNFETFVKNFLEKHLNDQSDGIGIMAKCKYSRNFLAPVCESSTN